MFRRVLLTFALAVGLAVSASAQGIVPVDDDDFVNYNINSGTIVYKPYALSIGPKVGVNYSIAGDPDGMDLGMTGNIGFSAGAAVNLRFGRPAGKPFGTERFGVQLEALYSMHSLKTDVENINMSCFEIPVLFQWYFLPTFAAEVGPTFTGAFSASPKEFKYNNAVYQMDKMKAYDVMLSIGVNCKLKNGFTADLRYNLGNSDIAGNFQTKVSTISLGIGWLFNVIK
ncbi:MAG: PorT family protein [Muribaculaceae bacterium]|nr:PorT family protein [Muribaculaceae bacterium]